MFGGVAALHTIRISRDPHYANFFARPRADGRRGRGAELDVGSTEDVISWRDAASVDLRFLGVVVFSVFVRYQCGMPGKLEQGALFEQDVLGVRCRGRRAEGHPLLRHDRAHRAERDRNHRDGVLVDQPVRRLRVRLRVLLRAIRASLGARPPRDGESRARRHAVRARRRCRPGSRSSGASSSSRTPPTCCAKRCVTDRRSISRCCSGETIVIGTATDPFQPAERRFRITRSVLEVLADHPGLSICIITKSPLITRDIDVLQAHQSHLVAHRFTCR